VLASPSLPVGPLDPQDPGRQRHRVR
jgi:hypothetical protein